MKARTLGNVVAFGLLAFTSLTVVVAAPDDVPAELKKARKELKKNLGKLQKMVAAMEEKQAAAKLVDVLKEPEKKKKIEGEAEEIRVQALETVSAVAAADNEDAVEFLLPWTMTVKDQQLFEKGRDALGRFTDATAQKHLLDVLVGDLTEEGKKAKKKGGKQDPQQLMNTRCLVAQVCEVLSGDPAADALATVIEKEPNSVLVNAAIAGIGTKETKRLVTVLIGLLSRVDKVGGWEYFTVRDKLMKMTGEDFLTGEKWSEWWKANEGAFDFAKKGSKTELGTRVREKSEAPPTFFGSEIASNRLCFIIDTSGSMQMTDRPPETTSSPEEFEKQDPDTPEMKALSRIERAKKALVDAIKNLQPTQKFNIVRFSGGVENWKPSVVEATEENRKAAIAWAEGFKADGGTYTDDALKKAFADPEIDTIYLLSDGAPYKKVGSPAPNDKWPKTADGKIDQSKPVAGDQQIQFAEEMINDILDFVRLENRFRKVKIYTFGMDGPGVWHKKWTQPRPVSLPTDSRWLNTLSSFMRNLASLTGGEFKSI